jgi:hypothetical protein
MSIALVVTRKFGPYEKGEQITDLQKIQEIRASSNHANVVAVTLPEPIPPDQASAH